MDKSTLPAYAPLQEARRLSELGRYSETVDLLSQLPEVPHENAYVNAALALELQRSLFAIAQMTPSLTQRLLLLAQEKSAFYRAVFIQPHFHEAYLVHARFWRLVGRDDMAKRLLQTLQTFYSEEDCSSLFKEVAAAQAPTPFSSPLPQFRPPKGRLPRILILVSPSMTPGMDALYDGFCRELGVENVVEYPYKPCYHDEKNDATQYLCTYTYPGRRQNIEELRTALLEGAFDLILYADMRKRIPRDVVRTLLQAGKDIPVAIVDDVDNGADHQRDICEHLGREQIVAYFKREMFAGVEYGPNTIPLPLSYPDSYIPPEMPLHRRRALFWAGKRMHGLRRLYIEHLESVLGIDFTETYPQSEYVRQLINSHIGFSFFGFGYDTLHYYEIPAHGALLLAERSPVIIPQDFEDGVSALFFENLHELLEKVAHFMHHPTDIPVIAANGHAHLRRYHTASARARQLLAHVYERL